MHIGVQVLVNIEQRNTLFPQQLQEIHQFTTTTMVYPEKNSTKAASSPSTAAVMDNEDEFNESLDINGVDLSDAAMGK